MCDKCPEKSDKPIIKDFVHLHCHSHYSLLDGLSSPDKLAEQAKKLNFGAMGLTDHGTCSGLFAFQKACGKNGIKPILGCELYITKDHRSRDKNSKINHLLVTAKNEIGLKNLYKLSSIAEIDGKYKKPRIDFELLTKHHEGLICTSGCPVSPIQIAITEKRDQEAENLIGSYRELFKDDFYIEVMAHKYFAANKEQEDKEKYNAKKLIEFSKKLGIKAIATNDVHYAEKLDAEYHDVLLAMQTHSVIKDPDRFTFNSDDFYIKSYEEMAARYKSYPELLLNTMEIAEKTETNLIKFHPDLLPKFEVPSGYNSEEEYLKKLVKDGMEQKGLINDPIYRERIKFEMTNVIKCGYTRYFLILWDIINFAKLNKIALGIGRGSAAGSLALYVLGVTGADPIKFNLLFERFINPERISPPDVDLDFDHFRRDEVFNYITRKYGQEYTCKIGTYNSLKPRAVMRYAVKAMDLGGDWEIEQKNKELGIKTESKNSLFLADRIAKQVPEGPTVTLESAIKDSPEFQQTIQKYPKLLEVAKKTIGKVSSAGVHAAGIAVCKDKILDHLPLRERDGVICSQYAKEEVEELGLLKFDCLGLKTVTVIDRTVKLIKERKGIDIDTEKIPLDDAKSFALLNGKIPNMDNRGVFQLESWGIAKLVRDIRVDSIEDIIVANALYRPGPLGAKVHELYCDYKHGVKPIKPLHPIMGEVLKDTYSLVIFQENFMKLAQEMAGFTKGESDTLRKCVTDDTLFISKTRGWISIRDLLNNGYKDDLFLTMDEKGIQKWTKITDIWNNGSKRVSRTLTKTGFYVDTTGYHQILTATGWKAKRRLKLDDHIVCVNKISYEGEDRISRNMAIIIAGIITEGYFVRKSSTFVNYDPKMMNIFINAYEAEFNTKAKLDKHGRVCIIPLKERLIINKIINFGLSDAKIIPTVMMGMSLETTRIFLSFMLGAEGVVSKKEGRFEYSSKSWTMINQVKLLLLRFEVSSFIHKKVVKGQNYYRLYINEVADQIKMVNSLLEYWPQYKIDDIKININRPAFRSSNIVPQTITKKMLDQYPQAGHLGSSRGGNIYSSNIRRDSFSKIAEKTNDKYWIDLANGNQRYDLVKDVDYKRASSMNVYDFTVEDSNSSIIANGIVIHNCVGKKDIDKLKQQRGKFVEGSVKKGVSSEIANEVFSQIEFFGGYGFNRSHSVVYSLLSLQTAYLKTHYPVEFMCNLLSSEIGDEDKLPLYLSEAKRMGIHILPPHFNKSKKEYTVESVLDKRTGKKVDILRTPLNFVKGVGDKALDTIVNSQPFTGLMDFLSRVELRAVNSKVFNALVDDGALNGIEGEMKGEEIKKRYEECKVLIEKKKKVAKKEEANQKQWGGSLFDTPSNLEIKL